MMTRLTHCLELELCDCKHSNVLAASSMPQLLVTSDLSLAAAYCLQADINMMFLWATADTIVSSAASSAQHLTLTHNIGLPASSVYQYHMS